MGDSIRDEALMLGVFQGRRDALETLVRRYATSLLTFLTRMTGDHHRAEELFQEVFLAVWLKRHTYGHPQAFKPWLYTIAINRCRAAFRRKHPHLAILDDVATTQGAGPDEIAIAVENAALVTQAVALLPVQQRLVVSLRVWEQMHYGDIADILNTTQGTARSYMHHALCALRKYLEPKMGDR